MKAANNRIQIPRTTGHRIKSRRQQLNMTQAELAEAAEVGQPYISMIENDLGDPSAAVIASIARKLKVSSDYLLLLTDDSAPDVEVEVEAEAEVAYA